MNYKKIFMVMALAAFAVFAQAQVLDVFISDATGSPTNVRNAPNGKVVAQLNPTSGIMIGVESPKNGWWKITDNYYSDPDKDFEDEYLKGSTTGYWIHHSVLAVATRNYGGETLRLRKSPSSRAQAVYSFNEEIILRPMEVKGDWVKVKTTDGKHTGWIEAEWLCGNSVTNCI